METEHLARLYIRSNPRIADQANGYRIAMTCNRHGYAPHFKTAGAGLDHGAGLDPFLRHRRDGEPGLYGVGEQHPFASIDAAQSLQYLHERQMKVSHEYVAPTLGRAQA